MSSPFVRTLSCAAALVVAAGVLVSGGGVASAATPPSVTVTTLPHYFSPNGDGVEDDGFVDYCLTSHVSGGGLASQLTLTITVTDSGDATTVRSLETGQVHGEGCIGNELSWDAKDDNAGAVADGVYHVHIHAQNTDGASSDTVTSLGVDKRQPATLTQPTKDATINGTSIAWAVVPVSGVTLQSATVSCDGPASLTATSSTPAGDGSLSGTWDTNGCTDGVNAVHTSLTWTDALGGPHWYTALPDVAVTSTDPPSVYEQAPVDDHRYFTPNGDGYEDTGSVHFCVDQAANVDVKVKDGISVVRTLELAVPHAAQNCPFSGYYTDVTAWDGRNNSANVVPAGSYTMDVQASNAAGSSSTSVQVGVRTAPLGTLTQPSAGATLTGLVPWTVTPAAGVQVTAAAVSCNGASALDDSDDTPAGNGTFGGTWDTSGCSGGVGPVHSSVDWTDDFGATHSSNPLADVSVAYVNAPAVTLPVGYEHRYITPDGDGYGDSTTISYCVTQDSAVTTTVTNASNTVVRTIEDATPRSASANGCDTFAFLRNIVSWDGKNDGGDVVPDGVYTVHVVAANGAGNDEATLDVGVSTAPPATVAQPASGATVSGTTPWKVVPASGVPVSSAQVTCTGVAPASAGSGTPNGDGSFSGTWDTTGCSAGNNSVIATASWQDPFGQQQTSVLPATPFTSANAPSLTTVGEIDREQMFDPTKGEHGDISYCVNQDATVTVTVVNATDDIVRTLAAGVSRAANTCASFSLYDEAWDGKDANGVVVPNGTYTIKVHAQNAYGPADATQLLGVETRPAGAVTAPASGGTLAGLATIAMTPTSGFSVTQVSFSFDSGGTTLVTSADGDGVWRAHLFTGSLVAGSTTLRTMVTWTNPLGQAQTTALPAMPVVIDSASLPIALHLTPGGGPAPLDSTITLDTSDPQGRDVSYTINFGDGSAVAAGTVAAPYAQVLIHHTFAAGTFHVHASVSNGQGGTASTTIDVISSATTTSPPAPTLSLDVSSGTAPLPVVATISATDPDSPNLTYGLVWGDGTPAASGALQTTTATPVTIAHTFTSPGNYTVTLTVSDGTQANTTHVSTGVIVEASGPAPGAITTTLTPSATTVGPGAVTLPIDDIPTETLKTLGADVANAPMLRRAPEVGNAPMLRRAPLTQIAASLSTAPMLRRAPLTSFTVDVPGGWPALLAGTPLADVPLQSLTLGDVLDLLVADPPVLAPGSPLLSLAIGDLQLEGSPLDTITPAALLLGATPVMTLVYADGTPWCIKLAAISPHHETCASLGVTSTSTLISLDLRPGAKAVLDAAPTLRRPPIAANATTFTNAHASVIDARLDEENLDVTRIGDLLVGPAVGLVPQLAALPISGLPSQRVALVVTCGGPLNCATATLGDAAAAGRIKSGATLADAQGGLGAVKVGDLVPALPATIEVNDVLTGFLDKADFPWETLDLLKAGFQEFAPGHPTVHWDLAFHTTGGNGPWTTTAAANLPPGWRILPGTVSVPGSLTSLGKPALQEDGTGSQLLLTLVGTQPGASYDIGFDAVPPLALGTNTATSTVSVAGGTATSPEAKVTVVESADPSATPASATPLGGDVLYFGHIATAGDVDLFSHTPAAGANDGVRLSHLAGDADLVLYGPPTDAVGSGPSAMNTTGAAPATPPLADAGYTGDTQVAQPNGDADLAGIDGLTVAASSATSSDVESAAADNVHLVEVRSYNGATSNLPYVLRIRETVPAPPPTCPAYSRNGGTAGSSVDIAALPHPLNTLVLVNQRRMGDTYDGSDVSTMMTALGQLAADPTVRGAVVPVESVGAVASAYSTWNSNPCNADKANGVVAAIDGIIKQARASHPELANIVIVGNDDMIPMARLTDSTRWGNETTYADVLGANTPLHAALASGHTLSDDPYGDLDPIPWLDRRLYVPDLAVGRLVETPPQITAQANLYLSANGVLDTGSAYSAGYDFMSDGATAVSDALTKALTVAHGSAPAVTNRISGAWSAADLLNDLATGPAVASIDGHFDHNSGLAAAGFTNGTADTFSASQLANALPAGARLVFSMGCHAGLSVPDAGESTAVGIDNPASLAQRGAVFLAATGYGYGDQSTVGLHERLMTLFAGQLDGSVSIGQAEWLAKQQYFASEGLYGAYDEKVLSSTVLYGLPMWRLTPSPTTRPAPATVSPTDIGGGLSSIDRTITSTFAHRSGADGDWYEVNNPTGGTFAPLTVAGRPVQPRVDVDVTAASGGHLLPAHGALVTSLTNAQAVSPFAAALARPSVDESAIEPTDTVTDLAFPSTFTSVTTSSDVQGVPGAGDLPQRQHVVVIPGQFRGSAGNGATGRQDLYGSVGVRVYYSTSTDTEAPTFGTSSGVVDAGTHVATFDAHVTDTSGIVRVLVLYDAGAGWQQLDLTDNGAGDWHAATSVPNGATSVRYLVQAVDGAGNVGASTGKGDGLATSLVPPPPAPGPVSVSFSPLPPANGFYGATPTITVNGSPGVTYTVTVDGQQPGFTYVDSFSPSGLGTGTHTIDVHGSDGGTATKTFTLDLTAPTITASVSPAANGSGWHTSAPTVTFSCADEGSGVAQCSAPVTVSTDGRGQVITGTVTDQAGNGATASVTLDVDTAAPTVGTVSIRPTSPTAGQAFVLSAPTSDALSGVVAGEWFVGTDPGVGNGKAMTLSGGVLSATTSMAAGTRTIGVRSRDAAGNWSATRTRSVTVLPVPQILISLRADRKKPVALSGRKLLAGHKVYIFVRPPAHTKLVRFWLDDPRRAHKPRRSDSASPYDFVGNAGALALPYAPKAGAHSLTIGVTAADGTVYVMTVKFRAA